MTAPRLRALAAADGVEALTFWKGIPGLGMSPADEPTELTRFFDRNPGLSYGAYSPDGRLVGTCLAGHDGRRGFLYHLAVAPAYRGLRLSTALIEASLAGLQAEGIQKVHLFVLASNAAGLDFWVKADVRGWVRRDDLLVFSRDV
ncbi:MAG: GNAT family N-acetyltransferase [Spirochaetales bacterium]